mgnify:CR=1 FL=1
MIHPVAGLVVAYLAGSIPAAYIAGRLHGVDLRKVGSGNLGATNAVRVLGFPTGVAVYVLDTLKGFLPVSALVPLVMATRHDLWAIAIGVAAIAGHVRPIYLGFQKGGKGVATAGGVFLALAPLATVLRLLPKRQGFSLLLSLLCPLVSEPVGSSAASGDRFWRRRIHLWVRQQQGFPDGFSCSERSLQ